MRTLVFSAIIFAFVISSNTHSVSACTCLSIVGDDKRQVGKAYEHSSGVFAGEVIEIIKKSEDYSLVKFKVEEIWKGKSENEITLKVSQNKSGCAYYPFELRERYLVYSYEYENEMYLPSCSRTSLLEPNKDKMLLNKIKKKKTKSSPK